MREARGVLLRALLGGAENIPFEPEPGNAGAGNGLPGTHTGVPVRQYGKGSPRAPMQKWEPMEVLVNGKTVELKEKSSVQDLIHSLSLSNSRVAVAVNNQVIPREKWASTVLKKGDKVLIVKPIQGG